MTTEILRNMLYRVDDDSRPSAADRLKVSFATDVPRRGDASPAVEWPWE